MLHIVEMSEAVVCPAVRRRCTHCSGEWTDPREMTVTVGLSPDVSAAHSGTACTTDESCITLLDGGVRNEAFAVLSSSGSTPVLGPDQPPEVSAALTAPQVTPNYPRGCTFLWTTGFFQRLTLSHDEGRLHETH